MIKKHGDKIHSVISEITNLVNGNLSSEVQQTLEKMCKKQMEKSYEENKSFYEQQIEQEIKRTNETDKNLKEAEKKIIAEHQNHNALRNQYAQLTIKMQEKQQDITNVIFESKYF